MNNTTINTDDIIAASTIFVLSFIAIVCYSTILVSIYKIWKKTKNAFYILLIPLGLNDISMLCSFAFYSTPATIIQRPLFGPLVETLIFGTLCNFTYFASYSMLVNIAFNRYWSICRSNTSVQIYDSRKVFLSIFLCQSFGAVTALAQTTGCCSIIYFDYTWGYDMRLNGNAYFVWYDRFCNLVGFLLLSTFYGLITIKLVKTRRTSTIHATSTHNRNAIRKEARLAMQSATNSVLLVACCVTFTTVPSVTDSKWANFSTSIVYIAAVGIHPFVYFSFNTAIRKETIDMIPCLKRCFKMKVAPNPANPPMS